jgi:hypothetical protein
MSCTRPSGRRWAAPRCPSPLLLSGHLALDDGRKPGPFGRPGSPSESVVSILWPRASCLQRKGAPPAFLQDWHEYRSEETSHRDAKARVDRRTGCKSHFMRIAMSRSALRVAPGPRSQLRRITEKRDRPRRSRRRRVARREQEPAPRLSLVAAAARVRSRWSPRRRRVEVARAGHSSSSFISARPAGKVDALLHVDVAVEGSLGERERRRNPVAGPDGDRA